MPATVDISGSRPLRSVFDEGYERAREDAGSSGATHFFRDVLGWFSIVPADRQWKALSAIDSGELATIVSKLISDAKGSGRKP